MLDFLVVQNLEDSRLSRWDELLSNSHNPLPFQRREWLHNWWRHFSAKKDKPFIILAYKDKELIGLAPLMCRMHKQYASLKFIGTDYFDYFDFIVKKNEEDGVISGFVDLINCQFPYFELGLRNIFGDSKTLKLFKQQSRSNHLIFFEDTVPYVELPETKEDFHYQIKGTLRWDVSRRERRLGELGDLQLGFCSAIDEARLVLEDFFTLHIKKWESAGGYSAFKFEKMRQFMRGMLEGLFPSRAMNLFYLLHNNQRRIAICPGFEFGRRFIFYTHAYDSDFANYSPGKLLIGKLINYSIDNKYAEFDFGIGKEPYKLEWPCKIRNVYNIYLYKDKDSIYNHFLRLERCIASNYRLRLLPVLRKCHPLTYAWRWLNRRKGRYRRFQ